MAITGYTIPIDRVALERALNRLRNSMVANSDSYYEFVKQGNLPGDDNNWAFVVNGNNLDLCYRESGSWVVSRTFGRRP